MRNSAPKLARRAFLSGVTSLTASVAFSQNVDFFGDVDQETSITNGSLRNISSFRMLDWRPYFKNLKNGAILSDINSRVIHFWSENEEIYKLYPTSVPITDELTRKGRTEVVRKVVGPSWRPTPEMRKRNPEWPDFIGPGSDNPLGSHALYLSWTYYRIHGTHDTRKIGRKSSNGCIGLYNEQIAELFELTKVGSQVLLI
ncbi:L,D-transpeptidase [uncultured Planktomarina sp.]|jgi:L,D-transpeptidase ErfK/SrfK|uniref:L,D-transpeptidase n=1 Tax=uncultured Planktomarina sp. TaxID=1538529 RepID=UPI0032614683|tara:strand:- start:494 stop:1093 length:600 start_codon:yes stop_codon:yes gene_type:complete